LSFLSRRKFLQAASTLVAGSALAVAADATLFQPNEPQLVEIEIPLARLPEAWDGFRIAQLSDFHYDPYFSAVPIRKAVAAVNRLRPDVAVLTGDFVSTSLLGRNHHAKQAANAIDPCAALLRELRIIRTLEAQGIPVLRNRSTALVRGDARLWFAGIDDALEADPDLPLSLQGIPPNECVILLAHEPDFAVEASRFSVDLQLSGHSHGGQVRLPLLGAPVLPPMGLLYPRGLHRLGGLTLYTNVGIGTVVLPIRLNCPPEITLITLRSES
jgi:uncharacterized protein